MTATGTRPEQARAHSTLIPLVYREAWRERTGGHPVDESHAPHYVAALDWLARAQNASGCGGIARGYSLGWNRYFGLRGWEPAYPETTGYIIPTFYLAAWHLDRPGLAARASIAARWECDIQLPSGAVQGGVVGQNPAEPAVFNTGQVLFGWLAAYGETGEERFAEAAERAACWLVGQLDPDGIWRRGNSRFAAADSTLYNTRTAWALAEAGLRLETPQFTDAAARSLAAVARRQRANGWFPDCCLTDPQRPLLHTIAYAIRGLLEGGRVLGDWRLVDSAATAADAIAGMVDTSGRLPGRFFGDWRAAATYSCLTGQAQMANIWQRLAEITGALSWLEPVAPVLRFLKSTQNRATTDPGLNGGIKGSFPLGGEYGRHEVLSWATKFFVDALIRHERILAGVRSEPRESILLA